MASRNTSDAIQSALKDLFAERDVVEDAIVKLQSLLETMKLGSADKRRRAAPGRRANSATLAAKPSKGVNPKGAGSTRSTSAWSPAARRQAAQRMRDYWAKRQEEIQARKKTAAKRRPRGAAGK